MTKTQKLTVAATVFVTMLGLFSYIAFTAYAAASLFGGASFGVGHVILVSDVSDVNVANDSSGISFDDADGEVFSTLSDLRTDFNVTNDNCGAGSPRFRISIDTNNDTTSDGDVLVNLGPSPSFNTCTPNTWTPSGNLIGNNDAGRWDFTGGSLGGPLGGYSDAPANVLNGKILDISIVVDGGADPTASGTGDGEQTVLIDNVSIIVSASYDFEPPTFIVDNNAPYCPGATYITIQAAVNAASSGDTVTVCAGTYDEQVVIASKDLTLEGAGATTIIRPSGAGTLTTTYSYPSGMYAPWTGTVMSSIVLVTNTGSTTVKDLAIDGVNVTTVPAGASRVAGILYGETGGTIDNVSITEMVVGAYATRTYGIDLSAGGTARSVEVKDSDITDWSRNGIQVQGGSLTADIHDNTLIGPDDVLVGAAVPNGILFIHGAGGNATGNTISALHHSLSGSRSAGILFFDPVAPGIVVEDNDISDTDDGVNISANANDVIVRNNNLHDNLEVGIHLEDGATDTTITGNTITGNDTAGIRFAGAADPGGPSLADDPPGAGNVANRNDISGNINGVVNYGNTPQTFDATCNWWGSASGPSGSGPGTGDSVNANVTFQPWLTALDLSISGPCDGPLPPAPQVTVTIVKYIDGIHATVGNANSSSFPMLETWVATNFSGTNVPFDLDPTGLNTPNAYEAKTSPPFDSGASITMNEVTSGPNVGASCADGYPFALSGYSTGETEALAAGNATSSSVNLTNITTDKFVIVWNETCAPAPTTGTLTLQKTVIIDSGGAPAADTDWTLNASGPTPLSGIEGNASVTNAVVTPGTYDLSESGGPAGYTASAWVCTGGTDDSDTVTISAGENVTCTITNDDTPPAPVAPPPANACSLSSVPGYTLQNGTAGSDNVTIAPFTMFFGLGGNDIVKGPAAGNYIVCLGSGSDVVKLGSGASTIDAGDGNNSITTGNGNGYVTSGSGNDKIVTGSGNNTIDAGSGNNTVKSGGGNDFVTSGTGNDSIDGGADFDTCNAGSGFNSVANCEA